MSYEEELLEAEEKKKARLGACAAVILVPTICLCVTALLLSYTSGGRILVSSFMLNGTYHGNFLGFVGFADIAKSSCALDRSVPRPGTYDEDQKALETRYYTNLRIYTRYWNEMKKSGGSTGQYPPPSNIAQTFADAKAKYCR